MNSTITSDTHRLAILKSLTRVLWLLMFAVLLTLFAAVVPLRFEQLMTWGYETFFVTSFVTISGRI